MKNILVFGAGAIGRGYVPWLFDLSVYSLDFVEKNTTLISELESQGIYSTFMTKQDSYDKKEVPINKIYQINMVTPEIIDEYDFVITAVGPRQFMGLSEIFKQSSTPVICFENDRNLVGFMKTATGRSNIFFGIPDVITSSSSSKELEKDHKNCLITEEGVTFIEEGAQELGGEAEYIAEEEIRKQWAAKLYIHNTPHCIAAYLGSLLGKEFLHEAMLNSKVYNCVKQVAEEMSQMTQKEFHLDKKFASFYLDKEIARFSNPLLFDPISRIAREPFRKLALNDRLIGAATKAIANNISITATLTGIISAFSYDDPNDDDRNIRLLFDSLDPADFLSIAVGLSSHEVLFELLQKHWDQSLAFLEEIKNEA